MSQAAEHYVCHIFQLPFDSLVQFGAVVPVHGAPPRRHAVYQLGTVRQCYHASFRPFYLVRRQRVDRRCVRMPQMVAVELINKFINIHNQHFLFVLYLLVPSNPAW